MTQVQPASLHVDPEAVIQRLAQQVGSMAAELAMRDAALAAAQDRIAELEQAAAQEAPTDS